MGSDSTLAILKPTVKKGQTASVFTVVSEVSFSPSGFDFLLPTKIINFRRRSPSPLPLFRSQRKLWFFCFLFCKLML